MIHSKLIAYALLEAHCSSCNKTSTCNLIMVSSSSTCHPGACQSVVCFGLTECGTAYVGNAGNQPVAHLCIQHHLYPLAAYTGKRHKKATSSRSYTSNTLPFKPHPRITLPNTPSITQSSITQYAPIMEACPVSIQQVYQPRILTHPCTQFFQYALANGNNSGSPQNANGRGFCFHLFYLFLLNN